MIPKGQGETTELTDETRALMPPQVLAAMDSYLQGTSQLSDLDLIRIPANKIEDLLIQDGNEAEIESLFEPPTPNLGNVFVGSSVVPPTSKAPVTTQNLLFMGGDPRAIEGASSFDDEVEAGPSEWWDQLLAAGVLPPDVVASGIRVSDEVLKGLFPQAMAPVDVFPAPIAHRLPAPIQQQQGPPRQEVGWRAAVARDTQHNTRPTGWVRPYPTSSPPPPARNVSVNVSGLGTPAYNRVSRRSVPRRRDSEFANLHTTHQSSDNPSQPRPNGSDKDSSPGGLRGGSRSAGAYRFRGGDVPPSGGNSQRRSPPPPPSGGFAQTVARPDPSFAKLRSTFKLPSFSGKEREWKDFEEALDRFVTVHGLGHVMDLDFDVTDPRYFEQNQLFYYALQESVAGSHRASGYFKSANKWDGHGAYTAVHSAYNFMGPTTAALLLKQLTDFRIKESETHSGFVFRMIELFDELECVPGDAAYVFNDMQKIGYLLAAISQEPSLKQMHLHIQTNLSRGSITWEQACADLVVQCDDARAQEVLTNGGVSKSKTRRGYISSHAKSLNAKHDPTLLCMVADCKEKRHRGLCREHYTQLGAGKAQSLKLRNSWGTVTWDASKNQVSYPAAVPADRIPGFGTSGAKTSA